MTGPLTSSFMGEVFCISPGSLTVYFCLRHFPTSSVVVACCGLYGQLENCWRAGGGGGGGLKRGLFCQGPRLWPFLAPGVGGRPGPCKRTPP